jgi:hypothetical protein
LSVDIEFNGSGTNSRPQEISVLSELAQAMPQKHCSMIYG